MMDTLSFPGVKAYHLKANIVKLEECKLKSTKGSIRHRKLTDKIHRKRIKLKNLYIDYNCKLKKMETCDDDKTSQ